MVVDQEIVDIVSCVVIKLAWREIYDCSLRPHLLQITQKYPALHKE